VGELFAEQEIAFCSFNFSHNGGTVTNPIDFPDLEAFANNRYSYELEDLKSVINWLIQNGYKDKNIHLIGHSRGGGIAVIGALENEVKSLTTWASIADFEERFPKGAEFEEWKKEGVRYVLNGRTKQKMPHYFSFYEDFTASKQRLSILDTALKLETKKKTLPSYSRN
jgi:pimeloyl-ACP methyl ester carboxylesterase